MSVSSLARTRTTRTGQDRAGEGRTFLRSTPPISLRTSGAMNSFLAILLASSWVEKVVKRSE